MTPTTIQDVASAIETWAPKGLAESYDNPGLQVGDLQSQVSRGLIALDMTPQVLAEAVRFECNLIVTHHPLLFKPLSSVTPASYVSNLCLRLAEEKIGLYSAHTNLDSAPGGVSFALAKQLSLENIRFLSERPNALVKLVIFVPEESAAGVRDALADAGTGAIGQYSGCSFSSPGTGFFTPGKLTDPAIGAPGCTESTQEVRVETEVTRWNLADAVAAARQAHPYDEMAYDVYPVEQPYRNAGIGAIGELVEAQDLSAFLDRVATAVDNPALRFVGDQARPVKTVAVCGGSGSRYLSAALAKGADAFITADITYHHFFDALANDGLPRIALIDPGHYETEQITEKLLVDFLSNSFPDIPWQITETRTGPVHTYIRSIHTDSSQEKG